MRRYFLRSLKVETRQYETLDWCKKSIVPWLTPSWAAIAHHFPQTIVQSQLISHFGLDCFLPRNSLAVEMLIVFCNFY
jgi:hypothetical protein